MENSLGLLRIRVRNGVNIAVRDVRSSDTYVVVTMGEQKVKSRVVKNSCNPDWDDELTLSISQPDIPVVLTVYDHDSLSADDNIGDAVIDIKPLRQYVKMRDESLTIGTLTSKVHPSKENCLAEESSIVRDKEKVVQDMRLKLRNMERSEVQVQLEWINLPSSKGS